MKTRVVVWAVVGILVIVGVVFLLSSSSRGPTVRKDLETFKAQAERTAGQLDRLVERAEEAKASAPSGADITQKLAEFTRLAADARQKLDEVKAAAGMAAAEKALREARTLVRNARRALDLATGKRPTRVM